MYSSIGEIECIFSPQDAYMLDVNDCYVIANTLRFFSENNGAFSLLLRHIEAFLQLKPHPFFSKNYHLGDVRVIDWNSEWLHRRSLN